MVSHLVAIHRVVFHGVACHSLNFQGVGIVCIRERERNIGELVKNRSPCAVNPAFALALPGIAVLDKLLDNAFGFLFADVETLACPVQRCIPVDRLGEKADKEAVRFKRDAVILQAVIADLSERPLRRGVAANGL